MVSSISDTPFPFPFLLPSLLAHSDPVSHRSSLQSLASILSQNLSSLSKHLTDNHQLFSSMTVYPLPEFPGRTQEALLGQLLRKKLEPNVEDWVEEGRKTAAAASTSSRNPVRSFSSSANDETHDDLWNWARLAANEQARKHTWGGNYTLEEKQMGTDKVVTGLRRKLPDSDDEEEEEEEEDDDEEAVEEADEMEVVDIHRKPTGSGIELDLKMKTDTKGPAFPPLPMSDHFKFLMTGRIARRA